VTFPIKPCTDNYRAGVLIWRGSVKTKKREHVEDRLRAALGVPLAISGIKMDKNGSIINDTSPTPGALQVKETSPRGSSTVVAGDSAGESEGKATSQTSEGSAAAGEVTCIPATVTAPAQDMPGLAIRAVRHA
jgi:hypothetical protein